MASRQDILAYAAKTFQTAPDHPWSRYPEYAVLRHAQSGKWYALLMTLPRAKLGLKGAGNVQVVNLKSGRVLDLLLHSAPGSALPAYHMNKKHWITIVLDDVFPDDEIYALLDESHGLAR